VQKRVIEKPEFKDKISKGIKLFYEKNPLMKERAIRHDDKNGGAHAVYQIDPVTNEIIATFSTINNAKKATGIPHVSISACCRGIMKLARGFKWKYVNKLSRYSLHRLAHRIMKQLNITNYKVEVAKIKR